MSRDILFCSSPSPTPPLLSPPLLSPLLLLFYFHCCFHSILHIKFMGKVNSMRQWEESLMNIKKGSVGHRFPTSYKVITLIYIHLFICRKRIFLQQSVHDTSSYFIPCKNIPQTLTSDLKAEENNKIGNF